MKLLMFSDPHCTSSAEFSKPTQDGLTEYLQLFKQSFKFVEKTVIDTRPDILVFGGDFWDARDYIDTMSINVGQEVFGMLSALPVQHKIAIVGNHDYYSISHNIHTLKFLKDLGWRVSQDLEVFSVGEYRIACIPFRDSYDLDQLYEINEDCPDVALTHLDVVGGMRRPPKNEFDKKAYTDKGVPKEILDKCGVVLNGHYHHPSQVADNWYNVGSLTSRTFHDKDSAPRGLVLYDLHSKKYSRFVNPYAYDFTDVYVRTENDIAAVLSQDRSKTYARVHYNLDLRDEVDAVKDAFAGARMVPVAPTIQVTQKSSDLSFDARFSLEENLERYLRACYTDDNLISIAIDIYREAAQDYKASSSREVLGFGRLDIRNFQVFRHVVLDLQGPDLVFVRGINDDDPGEDNNGSGKSTILEALYWVLKGLSLRGFKANEVIGWHATSVRVSLELFVGDKVYTVVRSRKDPDFGTGVTLLAGGLDAGARLSSDNKVRLEDLIGRSDKNLRHTCFLLDDLKNRFSALNEEQRFKIVEDILDCEPYSIARSITKERLEKVGIEVYELRGKCKAYETQKFKAEESLKNAKAKLVSVSSDEWKESLQKKIKESEADKSSCEELISSCKEKVSSVRNDLKLLDAKIEVSESYLATVSEDSKGPAADHAKFKAFLSNIEGLFGEASCPTCLRPVSDQDLSEEAEKYRSHLHFAEKRLGRMNELLSYARCRMSDIKNARAARLSLLDDKVSALDNLRTRLDLSKDSLAKNKSLLESFENSRKVMEESVKTSADALNSVSESLESAQLELSSALERRHVLDSIYQGVFDRSGVRAALLSQTAIPFMNLRLQEYCQDAYGGKTISIGDDLSLQFAGNHSYKSNSRGQKRRVDFMMQFVLSDLASAVGAPILFLGLDEVLDSLDDSGVYSIKEILRKKSEQQTVLVISHNKYAAAIVPRQIVLCKRDGVSSVVEDTSRSVLMEG
ncbi:MAG: AAA family ATPase [Gammaproteobacteria bacterium]|nr:AAA family ATPase [Gammaproteobacteria bacterium]